MANVYMVSASDRLAVAGKGIAFVYALPVGGHRMVSFACTSLLADS